jgi:hypothetical protein
METALDVELKFASVGGLVTTPDAAPCQKLPVVLPIVTWSSAAVLTKVKVNLL